jgi:hypothetical protein
VDLNEEARYITGNISAVKLVESFMPWRNIISRINDRVFWQPLAAETGWHGLYIQSYSADIDLATSY